MSTTKLCILASGAGSNAEAIWTHFSKKTHIEVSLVLSNKKDAGVITKAVSAGIPCTVYTNAQFEAGNDLAKALKDKGVEWIVLAGFLRKIPAELIATFPQRIINIHPSLLPKFGGKGMYGNRVHDAVFAEQELETGITIHYVSDEYDEGQIIAQFNTTIHPTDGPIEIEQKVRTLELTHYPTVIEQLIQQENHG